MHERVSSDELPRSRTIVALAFAVHLPAVACTRFNPEFGPDGRDTGKTSGPLDDEDDEDDDADDDSASADDDGDTSATNPTTQTDDDSASSGDSGIDTGGSSGVQTTTGGAACSLSEPLRFGVFAADALGNTLPDDCGTTSSWQGAVTTTITPGELVVVDCGGSCSCADEGTTVHLQFTDLSPNPADLVPDGAMDCFYIVVSRRSKAEDCTVDWVFVETAAMQADHPAFLAANNGNPSWDLVVPQATLGEALDPCDSEQCEPPELPGDYDLFLGKHGPIAAGETMPIELNPYAGSGASYDVSALFAQVDESCTRRLGWAAILAP